MFLDKREIFLAAVFLTNTPFDTPLCNSGCAIFSAWVAKSLSPAAIALSTFLTKVLILEIRAWLTTRFFSFRTILFLAEHFHLYQKLRRKKYYKY